MIAKRRVSRPHGIPEIRTEHTIHQRSDVVDDLRQPFLGARERLDERNGSFHRRSRQSLGKKELLHGDRRLSRRGRREQRVDGKGDVVVLEVIRSGEN